MKSFKEYTKDKEELKQVPDGQYITNTHGSHAKDKEELKQVPDGQYITNTHGSHAKPKISGYGLKASVNYNESEEHQLPSWEEYLAKNHNPALGNDPEEHIALLNKHNPIHPSTIPHIRKYTESSDRVSTHLLKQFHAKLKPDAVVHGHQMGNLDHALNQHKLKHNLVVHSGIQFDPSKLESNKIIPHMSTSVDQRVASSFAENQPYDPNRGHNNTVRHVLRITIPKGHPAAIIGRAKDSAGKDISEFSNEHEVVIPRSDSNSNNTHMKFYKPEKYQDKNGVHYHVFPTELHSKEIDN